MQYDFLSGSAILALKEFKLNQYSSKEQPDLRLFYMQYDFLSGSAILALKDR